MSRISTTSPSARCCRGPRRSSPTGGIGTCAQALAAGIPHLVKPLAHDQADNGARLVRLGVGDVVPDRRYRAQEVARRLEGLLDRDTSDRTADLAGRMRGMDGAATACGLLEALLV